MADLRWLDNHCHLDDNAEATRQAARDAGVTRLIDVGCDLASSVAALERANEFDDVFATAGVHPHEAKDGLDGIEELLSAERIVAVGECGLDYYYDHSPHDAQRAVFAAQIEMAHRHDLPLVIHTRDAWDETFEILDSEGMPPHTVFHCFTGGPDEAAAGLERGAFLSFSGIVTFKSAADLQAAAVLCPLDRLMIETDSPYLAPVPHRGKPNQPANVTHVGAKIAELKDLPVADVASATWENGHRFYRLPLAASSE